MILARLHIVGMLVGVAIAAAILTACKRDESPPPPSLDQPLVLWLKGQHDDAVAALPEAPWDDPRADFTLELLTISEREFRRRSAADRADIQDEAMALAGELRAFARAVQDEYMNAREEDPAQATRLMESLKHLAARLRDRQRRLALFNLVGDAIQNIVDQHRLELEELDEASPG